MRRVGVIVGGLLALAGVPALAGGLLALAVAAPGTPPAAPAAHAAASPSPGYVDDRSCGACHSDELRRWEGSHHAKAIQPATATTVLGDFGGVAFRDRGLAARFLRRDGRFVVETEGPDGKRAAFDVSHTFGVAPLQQYLVEFPGGRRQGLTIAWDTARRRWFSLYPGRRFAPGDPLHWTGRYQNWNLMCAECHSTDVRKDYDAARDVYDTRWSAPTVGCQACHGPGAAHARSDDGAPRPRLAVDVAAWSARDEVDACARCHARRVKLTERETPGAPLLDDFRPQLLRPELYWPDGQQRGEVFEYGSFRQSAMYQRGVRCTDCHDPHAGTLRAAGNAIRCKP